MFTLLLCVLCAFFAHAVYRVLKLSVLHSQHKIKLSVYNLLSANTQVHISFPMNKDDNLPQNQQQPASNGMQEF